MSPPTTLPGGSGIRRITVIAVTDLPEPDSLLPPKVRPASKVKVTPSQAFTTPSRVKKLHAQIVDFE